MEHLQHAVVALIDHYGYVGLFVGLALGNLGAPVGTEIVLPVAGALTATGHLPSLWLTIVVALAGELGGGSVGYAIGRFGGVPIIERYGRYIHVTHDRLAVIHRFFERWGSFAIFVCRFLPVLRGIAAIPAGIAEMNLALFYLWTFLGSLIFCTALILLGNTLGNHLSAVLPLVHRGVYVALGVVVVAAIAAIVVRKLRARPA
ncbi:MAG: DedA family protein [Candidatus Eremiobacteraeota bacterium]|nr:DedA family protein [Candidatus Eremiobacteraeota bacterium]MBV9055040.1 DedA family protein [Candidatus Eremiobacteraeota bacterium]